jgi:hypothetical protein
MHTSPKSTLRLVLNAGLLQLPSVLWSPCTTPNAATRETPFFMVHSTEAVLLFKITHEVLRVSNYEEGVSTRALQDDVDALDKAKYIAVTRSA